MVVKENIIWISIVALAVALMPLPYAYYMLLRIGMCGVFAYLAYSAWTSSVRGPSNSQTLRGGASACQMSSMEIPRDIETGLLMCHCRSLQSQAYLESRMDPPDQDVHRRT